MTDRIKDINILSNEATKEEVNAVHITQNSATGKPRKLYIESYGCQMNFADSEVVSSIMGENGFDTTSTIDDADVIFLNTCSIRDKAEKTIRHRLGQFNGIKRRKPNTIIGVLGCMAERLKTQLLEEEKIVDLIAGPDAYRDLPNLVIQVDGGQKAANTILSREETYANINPVRLNSNGVSAYISITRGCDNMCTFCVVPFTRGRERSREPESIINEAKILLTKGYKEVTLLGQNVDSYKWSPNQELKGKAQIEKANETNYVEFSQLLEMVAKIDPQLRVRFSTSHPKDISNEVLYVMKRYDNICNNIHLPAQSGNSRILELMNRTYTREWYIERIDTIRSILGEDCGISSDMMTGFCTETEEEHQDTISLMDYVKYDFSYMFHYSERPGTYAAKKLADDVPFEIKKRRLSEIIESQHDHSLYRNKLNVGKTEKVLIEGYSKRSKDDFHGRTSSNKVAIFPVGNQSIGDYVDVLITDCTSGTLIGKIIEKELV
jgi:tRNA-2-methylthio-N6-dimethylallyladenosine synthase